MNTDVIITMGITLLRQHNHSSIIVNKARLHNHITVTLLAQVWAQVRIALGVNVFDTEHNT